MSSIDTTLPGWTDAVRVPTLPEKVMLPASGAHTGPQVDDVNVGPAAVIVPEYVPRPSPPSKVPAIA
jgi:hypothetical protein